MPVRIAVEHFAPTRSIRRVRNAHAGLVGEALLPRATIEQFRLFIAYQRSRHRDSEMAMMSYGDYRGMVEDTALRSAVGTFPANTKTAMNLLGRPGGHVRPPLLDLTPAETERCAEVLRGLGLLKGDRAAAE